MPVREDMHRSCGSASSRKRAIAAAVEVLGLQVSIRAARLLKGWAKRALQTVGTLEGSRVYWVVWPQEDSA